MLEERSNNSNRIQFDLKKSISKKLIFSIFLLLLFGCSNKILTYELKSNYKTEQISLDTKELTFRYVSRLNSGEIYQNEGVYFQKPNNLELIFPFGAELNELSPFKKGYHNIKEVKEMSETKISLKIFDLELMNRVDSFVQVAVFSGNDSTYIKSLELPRESVEIQNKNTYLWIANNLTYYDKKLKLPNSGEHIIEIYLQPRKSLGYFDTGATECTYVESKPILPLVICNKENGIIMELGIEGSCNNEINKFIIKK